MGQTDSVAVIVLGSNGKLVQYSSMGDMDKLLEQYAEACQHPHERFTNADLLKEYADVGRPDDASTLSIARKRALEVNTGGKVDLVGPSGQQIHLEGIKPAGFMDDKNYPVSPRSEKAYNEITSQFDQWIEQLNGRGLAHQQASPGPGSLAGGIGNPGGGGKRFKSLSIVVPENPSNPILARAGAAGEDAAPKQQQQQQQPSGQAHVATTAADGSGLLQHGSLGDSPLHSLAMPSPSNMLFGLSSDGLFTARGGLNLDLPTPDSTTNMVPLDQAGFDWPSSSRDNMLPGLSEDNESGEELPGGLMVTGRGIKQMVPPKPDGSEVTSGRAGSEAGEGGGGGGASGMDDMLTVSGVKVSGHNAAAGPGGFEFPGFSSSQRETPLALPQPPKPGGASIDIPLDL